MATLGLFCLWLLAACGSGSTPAEVEERGLPVEVLEPVPIALTQPELDNRATTLPDYQRTTGVTGSLSSAGSDTLANLMTLWSEAFKREYPAIDIQVQAAGSSTAPPALVEGTAHLGPMSRAFKHNESEAFEARYGYKPTALRVAIDAVAVFVHKDNPMEEISPQQLDAVFSTTRRCGAAKDIQFWGGLGLTGGWQERPIQLYGRNSVSGTYGYFKSVALCAGDYKNSVNEQPGSASVVQAVATSLNSIGYSGIGYKTSGVKPLAITRPGTLPVSATHANATDGSYPFARYFYIYINKPPNQPLLATEREFLKFVLSRKMRTVPF